MKLTGKMEITTIVGCSIDCRYCPQSTLNLAYGNRIRLMSLDDFKTCLDKIPTSVRIDFSGMAEPWLNPKCTDMLVYACQKGHPLAVYTTLVGMKQEDWEIIKDFNYEIFNIHTADNHGNSLIPVTNQYKDLLSKILSHKIKVREFVVGSHGEPHYEISDIGTFRPFLAGDRAGNLKLGIPNKIRKIGNIQCRICGELINRNVLLPDGTVLLCCHDYAMKHVLGNLKTQRYEEILNGEEANRIRKSLKNKDSDILCRLCDSSQYLEIKVLST